MFKKYFLKPYNLQLSIREIKFLDKLSLVLSAIFALTSFQRFWIHPSGAHTHRQSDTIGMAIAFSEELRNRGLSAFDFLLFPRVLQRGLLDGINVSEFPLLNVISGCFVFGNDPFYGVLFTSLLILLLNFWASFSFLPKLLGAWKVEMPRSICVLIWFSATTLASQSNVIMPEGVAFPLVVMGIVYLLDRSQRISCLLLGVVLCSVSIAVKPTVVIGLGSLVVLPFLASDYKKKWKVTVITMLLCLVFPAWWYVPHAKHILSFAQGPQIFALAHFNPLASLAEMRLEALFSILFREAYQGQLPIFIGWIFIWFALAAGEWILVLLYFGSLLAAISLDGTHIIVHSYYFIGTCVFSMVLMARTLGAVQHRFLVKRLLIVCLLWGVVFNVRNNIWIWGRDSHYWQVNWWTMGEKVRQIIPKGFHLVTDDSAYPEKLLFIGRSGTAGRENLYDLCKNPEYRELKIAFVSDRVSSLMTEVCRDRSLETKSVQTRFATWFVTLAQPEGKL